MRDFLFFLALLPFGWAMAQEVPATPSEVAAFKAKAIKSSKNARTIKSDFVQYKHLGFLSNDIRSSGKMTFKAPGAVKWEYTEPYPHSIVFKGDKLLIDDGTAKNTVNVKSNQLFQKLSELIVGSVKGTMFDDADFVVSHFVSPKSHRAAFAPKDKKLAKYIKSFELLFDKRDASVREVKMTEPSGDHTRIVLSNRKLNANVNDTVFDH